MKALLLVDYKQFELTDLPIPPVGPRDLLVRVAACGICGSDVHGYDGSTGRRIPPIVMGHEAAGVIEQTGSEVRGFSRGDRITFDSTISCGDCHFCRTGRINLCDRRRVLGVSCGDYRQHGCFAEYVAIPQHIAYRLPDGLAFEQAAMIEAVSIALHAVGRSPPKRGDVIVVIGAGMIGQLIIQALRTTDCGTIIAVDLDDRRLAQARQFGADQLISASAPDLVPQIQELASGRGADGAYEVVGAAESFATAVASVRKGGVITLVGNVAPKVELALQAVVTRELTLFGSCASSGEYPACLDLLGRGTINVKPLISAVAPLADGPQWFDRLYSREPGLMKVILKP
ncbi:MAG TPA: galactitol-1-phosphate 5-dehydrogenase [Tepidisphaeraceae bacterium]|nr:galactitol-1-phosphate 5-dehydrogenase [Tepidisphaeraceae bacterium]